MGIALEANIRTYALQDETIKAAFGERFYVDRVPNSPGTNFALLRQITNTPNYHYLGRSGRIVVFQLETFDPDKATLNANAQLLIDRFDGKKGDMAGAVIGRCWAYDVRGEFDQVKRLFRRIMELEITTND